MIQNFEGLSSEEFDSLKKAITWITILIAGADGNIDPEERNWASRLTKIRSYASDDILNDFYKEVGKDFDTILTDSIKALPDDLVPRTAELTDKLTVINSILSKLDNTTAHHLYTSYVSFADHVAKASGGFLRFFSVNSAESKLLALSMLNPIELIEKAD